jgi:hypothetical protein
MNERTLYQLFLKELRSFCPTAFYWKVPDTKGLGGKRCFDAILIHRGIPYCLEFKFGRRRPTPLQRYFLGKVKQSGATPVVLDETNWKRFIKDISDSSHSDVVLERCGGKHERPT